MIHVADEGVTFHVQVTSGVPIYRQIVEQVRAMAAGGRLEIGDMLPSVRQVAASLEVNPMTVSKAYSQLEAEGVVERVRGLGMQVRPPGSDTAQRRKMLRPLLERAAERGRQLGLSDDQIAQELQRIFRRARS